jgi:hypothetical protein
MPRSDRTGLRVRWTALGATAAVALSYSTPAPAPDIPQRYVLINGSGMVLTCTVGTQSRGWSPAFRLSAGAQWDAREYNSEPLIYLRCGKPVQPIEFQLVRRKRYVLEKPIGGSIRLVEAAVGTSP